MSNELYHILGAAYLCGCQKQLGNGVIIVIKDQNQGKTDTMNIFKRNHKEITKIFPGTLAAMYEQLKNNSMSKIFYVDDKSRWDKGLFSIALKYLKGVSDGEIAPVKMTMYQVHQMEEPMKTSAWVCIVVNKEQYDEIFKVLISTGIYHRAIILKSKHNPEEVLKITDFYKKNDLSKDKLPDLKLHKEWITSKGIRTLSDKEEKMLDDLEQNYRGNVRKIARIMSEDGFKTCFPLLQSRQIGYFSEEIEFEEVKK